MKVRSESKDLAERAPSRSKRGTMAQTVDTRAQTPGASQEGGAQQAAGCPHTSSSWSIADSKTIFRKWPGQYCWPHVVFWTRAPPSEKGVLLPPVECGWGLASPPASPVQGNSPSDFPVWGRQAQEGTGARKRDVESEVQAVQGRPPGEGTGSEDRNGTRHEAGDWQQQGQMGVRAALKGSSRVSDWRVWAEPEHEPRVPGPWVSVSSKKLEVRF